MGTQGLKLRKYFRGQVGPYQINFGSPHNLLGAYEARYVPATSLARCLTAAGPGATQGPQKPWHKWCKILHSGHFLAIKLAIQKL